MPEKERTLCLINLFDKTAFPCTSLILVILGIPLAVTPPRVRYNRGFLFSILIIFFYYIIRAFSISFGESGVLNPFVAAWLPNVIIAGVGALLYYKKAYRIWRVPDFYRCTRKSPRFVLFFAMLKISFFTCFVKICKIVYIKNAIFYRISTLYK